MEQYLGVKLIEAEPMTKRKFCELFGDIEGDYDKDNEDGYKIVTYYENNYKASYKTLSQELIRELFDYKDGKLYWKNKPIGFRGEFNGIAGYDKGSGYRKVGIFGDNYYVHRLIMKYHYGNIVDSYEIDHIDHNTSNNNLTNLRLVTSQENSFNLRSKGVSYVKDRDKWVSYLDINGKRISLGRYDTEEEALQERKNKQDELFLITPKFEIEWSPKDVFEKAYRRIKTLEDLNIQLVHTEGSFQDRVCIEAESLQENVIKLKEFIGTNKIFTTLPLDEQTRLKQQLMAMQYYLTILVERIENF